MRQKSVKSLKRIVLHILAWGIILSINISQFGGYFGHEESVYKIYFMINAPIWLIYLSLFYINYSIFIPKLLFKQNIIAYLFCAAATMFLSFVSVQEYKHSEIAIKMRSVLPEVRYRHSKKIEAENRTRENDRHSPLISSIRNDSTTVIDKVNILTLLLNNGEDFRYYSYTRSDAKSRHIYNNIYNFKSAKTTMQLYILLLILATSLGVGAVKQSEKKNETIDRIYREKLSSELSFLKQQINPHFLFNALNSIYSLVLPHSEQASDSVIKLSMILRYMLYETDKPQVSIEKELEVMRDYLALQRLKFNDVTSVSFSIKGETKGYTIEPLLLLTFIENAFKYGADNSTPSFININIVIEKHYLNMYVENKIVVRNRGGENSGIGISNIKRRLDLIYDGKYSLDIEQNDDIFSVKLKIKLL